MKIYDLSRPISKKEPVYPGNPPVVLTHLKKIKKDGSQLSGLNLGLHSATHIDAPLHYVKSGLTVDRVFLEKCVGWCRIVDMTKVKEEIGRKEVSRIKPKAGEMILFKTRNSKNAKRFDKKFVYLNEVGAKLLRNSNIKAVGIDGPSIRKFRLRPDTVHPMLLKAGIVIYEGLNLKNIKPGRYFFVGLPLRIVGAEASPVRAVLIK